MSDGANLPKSLRSEDKASQSASTVSQPPADATEREAAIARLIAGSPLFDADWYAAKHTDVAKSGLTPALHYLRIGSPKGWAPSPGFDGADYLARHKDVARTGMNPLQHYVAFGKAENRQVKPADPEELNTRLIAASGFFDEAWYKATYPEVARSRLPPPRYFLKHGRDKGHDPAPNFNLAGYILDNADVASSSINPLLHYLSFGKAEGRPIRDAATRKSAVAAAVPAAEVPQAAAEQRLDRDTANARIILHSPLFDAAWYMRHHPEVRASGLSPELHYITFGGLNGLAASAQFDSAEYLQRYDDVRGTGINPLVHYLLFGKAELRKIKPVDESLLAENQARASTLFDEAWYTATYPTVLRSKLSPLQHYLKHGREKSHNPGPGFDAADYLANNPDAMASKLNPLLHYLQIGKPQGRAIKPVGPPAVAAPPPPQPAPEPRAASVAPAAPLPHAPATDDAAELAADVALLNATPLFDASWYFIKYPEVARLGSAAAEHYLRHGTTEMRQPSIYFDPQYYIVEQSPEIQSTGINPLIHFLKTGRDLGRKPRALFEFVPSPVMAGALGGSTWPLAATGMLPQPAASAWKRQAELENEPGHSLLTICGVPLAFGSDITAITAAQDRINAFAILSGLDPAIDVQAPQDTVPAETGSGLLPSSYTGVGPELAGNSSRLVDAWFATDTALRVRFGDETVESRRPLVIRAFQCDPLHQRQPILAGEVALPPSGTCFADFDVANPLMALLLVLSEADGQVVELGLLPFPSLCRGGLHYSEIAGSESLSNPIDLIRGQSDLLVKQHLGASESRLLGRIEIDVTAASGAEQIFQPAFGAWLAAVFGLGIAAASSATGNPSGESYLRHTLSQAPAIKTRMPDRHGHYTLSLPADAIPTLEALVAGPAEASGQLFCGNYYVADAATARPRLSVVLPPRAENLLALQPDWAAPAFPLLRGDTPHTDDGGGQTFLPGHVAIRLPRHAEPHRAATLMPLAPDAAASVLPAKASAAAGQTIDAFIRASDAASLEIFIRSLINQRDVGIGTITVEAVIGQGEPDALQSVLDRLLPGKSRLVIRAAPGILGPDCLDDDCTGTFTVIADDTTVLHDARTASTLLALALSENTASASCLIVRESMTKKGGFLGFESGGYFPSHVSMLSAPRLILTQPDCRAAFPNTTYPVVANSSGFLMVRNACLREVMAHRARTGAAATDDGLEFALAALAAGYRHLCTSVVRAASLKSAPKREVNDPPGLAAIAPAQWAGILGAVAIVREIR